MHFKILGLIAAVALVAACAETPDESAAASGTGADTATTTASTAEAPAAASPAAKQSLRDQFVVEVGDRVYFDYDKYNLNPEARQILEKQAAWLNRHPQVTVTVEGHCDERGTREYNLALGERRANAVKDYLAALGISLDRIKTISYGKERPVAFGSNAAAWSQNRRAVTEVPAAGT